MLFPSCFCALRNATERLLISRKAARITADCLLCVAIQRCSSGAGVVSALRHHHQATAHVAPAAVASDGQTTKQMNVDDDSSWRSTDVQDAERDVIRPTMTSLASGLRLTGDRTHMLHMHHRYGTLL